MTLDGFCDHTAVNPDEEIHDHYTELLRNAGHILYGRKTYQLMEEAWPEIVKNPTGNKSLDDFAIVMDKASKIVFSRTLKHVTWRNSILKNEINKGEILELKEHSTNDLYAGSPGLIVALTQLDMFDEYQICIHPVVVGSGLVLFKDIQERIELELLKTKTFTSGAIILYYQPVKN
ncbi:MAG: dihydrofolate reductase [Bacteroidota bacterium]|nr:dihydrofolate reductase [Bacteroidota bacterium]